jgi:PST family polysaccharide transporter
MTLLTVALAPAIAHFYHDPRLAAMTMALGLGFLITGLGVQHQALLRRQMRFKSLAAIDLAASLLSASVGIVMALERFSYWSLVGMQLVSALTITVISWAQCGWLPRRPSKAAGVGSLVAFGGNLTLSNVLNYVVRNADNVLLGWRWGADTLGLYTRAYALLALPLAQIVSPIGTVVAPAMSRLQNEPERFRAYYLRVLKLIAYATVPAVMGLIVFSDEVVSVVLGPRWHPVSRLFRILSISAVCQTVLSTTGWIYTALARTRPMALWAMVTSPLMVLSFVVGLPFGAAGVATAFSVLALALTYPGFVVALRNTPISVSDVGGTIYRPVVMGAVLGGGMYIARQLLLGRSLFLMMGVSGILCAVCVLIARHTWAGLRMDIDDIVHSVRLLVPDRSVAAVGAGPLSVRSNLPVPTEEM